MAQRDYILRLIEQMGQVLIRLRKLLTGKVTGEEYRTAADAAATQFGLNPSLMREATPETLAMLLSPTVDPSRCWLAAELLWLEGQAFELEDEPDAAKAAYERAILLYRLIEPAGVMLTGWPEASRRITEIETRLSAIG
jgi:hypothetical protein